MRRAAVVTVVSALAALVPALPSAAVTDHKAPVVRTASLSRERVDVTLQDRKISAKLRITDNTGVSYVQVYLIRKDDDPALILTNPAERVSGTKRDGVYVASTLVPRHFEAGLLRLEVDVDDAYGNHATRVFDDVTLRVLDRDVDVEKPRLRLLAPADGTRVNVRRHAAVVPVRIRALDDKSGVDGFDVCLVRPNVGPNTYEPSVCSWADRVRGSRRDGVWESRVRLPRMALGGVWNVEASVTDHAHPYDLWRWEGPQLFQRHKEESPQYAYDEFFPFPHERGRIRVRGSVDRNPPTISKVRVSPTQLVEGQSATVTFTVWASDAEGVTRVDGYAFLRGSNIDLGGDELQLVRGTRKDGVWRGTFYVPVSATPGTYDLGFTIFDRAHYRYYREDLPDEPNAFPIPGPDHLAISPAP